VEFPYDAFMMKSVRYLFNVSTRYEAWDRSIRMLEAGVIPHEKLITHRGPVEQWESMFAALLGRKALKGMFEFAAETH
jgi:threonine dehydrogenase-like Zn-dependent dehydrogenase